jgi:hypothetical protein
MRADDNHDLIDRTRSTDALQHGRKQESLLRRAEPRRRSGRED